MMWNCECGGKFEDIKVLKLHKEDCKYEARLFTRGIRDSSDMNVDGDYYYRPATPFDIKKEYERLFGDK